jgi:hypothetical protein
VPENPQKKADPVIVFGAFDRHNFGDLLFPHIAMNLLALDDAIFAGLAARDLRDAGGFAVEALAALAARHGKERVRILHAGGEILTCTDWQAAVMLSPPEEAQALIARLDARPAERREWARAMTGIDALAPYVTSRSCFPDAASVCYDAAGGVDLDSLDAGMLAEVLAKLAGADDLSVRDLDTQAALARAGIASRLVPDPVVTIAELFGPKVRARRNRCGATRMLRASPRGYVAVQFSADFGDDRTLASLAHQLDRFAAASGLGIAFFRAGAAPWHDDLACYERVAARMKSACVKIFPSLDVWDICALIAHAEAYAGSSLHGRIVALAFGLPRVSVVHPASAKAVTKQSAFAKTWEEAGMPGCVAIDALSDALRHASSLDRASLRDAAARLAALHREGFAVTRAALVADTVREPRRG